MHKKVPKKKRCLRLVICAATDNLLDRGPEDQRVLKLRCVGALDVAERRVRVLPMAWV